ncbi:MAG: site-specific DNA-methyltransferase [Campylobacter sp.]|nr:site-specific DNA-methyltransferase [Campylobacter sp.]
MGSGTTLFECENLDRKYIGIDINEEIVKYVSSKMQKSDKQFFEILEFDSANSTLFMEKISNSLANLGENSAKFALFHPPYMDIVKFTDKNENLFGISDLKEFLGAFLKVVSNTLEFLEKNRYFAVVIGILYKNSEILPLGFYVIHYIKLKFKVKLKGVIVKNIEENRGKLKSGEIWTYRALRSDYYIFKHEYILVFKKEF